MQLVYLRPGQPAVVPCRVTDAQARVSLHREVPPEEIAANTTALVTYDPTKGFVLHKPTEDYQGVFYCKAETSGTPQISTKFQLLFVEGRDVGDAVLPDDFQREIFHQMQNHTVIFHLFVLSGSTESCRLFLLSSVPSSPPFVSLEASQQSVRGGDNVTVSCTVLGEPEADVTFHWTYPGQVRTPV